jgi:hypothetical protein
MAEEKRDLLQLVAGCPAQASACPAQIMWRQPIIADPGCEFFHYVPDQLLGDSVAPRPTRAVIGTGKAVDYCRFRNLEVRQSQNCLRMAALSSALLFLVHDRGLPRHSQQ